MLIARTLNGLQARDLSVERAQELGQMGYMQWLGTLPADADYEYEAVRAYLAAMDFIETDPAIAVFCGLIRDSLRKPMRPLDLAMPKARRRGGARKRRLLI
ncbi:hypothetical protein ACN2XU_07790 [Primorskyibacter sp. 2E107]|uniref:hypothetical protein n=1 Tax=Primorskyibacter sp. 2E107 TaxID=3403458 RepID=UPI003AF55875